MSTGVNVQFSVGWLLVRVGDTGEAGDDTSACLLVESLNVSALADLERGADVALEKLEACIFVELFGEVAVL